MKKALAAFLFFIGLGSSWLVVHLLLRLFFPITYLDSLIITAIIYGFILSVNVVIEKIRHE